MNSNTTMMDVGSDRLALGFAGNSKPRGSFPNYAGQSDCKVRFGDQIEGESGLQISKLDERDDVIVNVDDDVTEKVVGIIGGMGSEATVDFYSKLLKKTGATNDQDHLHVIINSNPKVPDRQKSIAGTGPSSAPALVETALALERSGADFLVMACNTAHAYEQDIAKATSIPFVSILSENVAASLRLIPNLQSVGLLAASGCVAAELYQSRFKEAGVRCMVPTSTEQAHLMNLIYRIKSGDHAPDIRTQMAQLAETHIERGAELILAACTEVPLALHDDDISKPLLDCTATLVDSTIAYAKGQEGFPDKHDRQIR